SVGPGRGLEQPRDAVQWLRCRARQRFDGAHHGYLQYAPAGSKVNRALLKRLAIADNAHGAAAVAGQSGGKRSDEALADVLSNGDGRLQPRWKPPQQPAERRRAAGGG